MTKDEANKMMVKVAKRRGIVRLDTGELATLVSWGTPKPSGAAGSTTRCRLESQCGEKRWTDKKHRVVEVVQ